MHPTHASLLWESIAPMNGKAAKRPLRCLSIKRSHGDKRTERREKKRRILNDDIEKRTEQENYTPYSTTLKRMPLLRMRYWKDGIGEIGDVRESFAIWNSARDRRRMTVGILPVSSLHSANSFVRQREYLLLPRAFYP